MTKKHNHTWTKKDDVEICYWCDLVRIKQYLDPPLEKYYRIKYQSQPPKADTKSAVLEQPEQQE